MNKTIALIIGGVIVVGGASAYLLTKEDKGGNTTLTSSNSQSSDFNPVSTDNLSFRATISTTAAGSETVKSVIESDAKTKAVRYTANAASTTITSIYTADAYYSCQGDNQCIKQPLGQGSAAAFDPKSYQYDQQKIGEYKSNSKFLGKEDCPAGTCDVWQVDSGEYKAKIYLDSKTRQVNQVVSEVAGATSKIVYEYVDITVTIPSNAQELPSITVPNP